MKLKEFLASMPLTDRKRFAKQCKTSVGHLNNVAHGSRSCRESLAILIEKASSQKVTCEELCPKVDWAYLRGSSRPDARTQAAA